MSSDNGKIRGADLVREVFARVRNGDLSVSDLYTENAIILYGADGTAEGREQIRAFYARTIEAMSPQPQVEAVVEDPPRFIAFVDVPTTSGHHRALDLFELDEDGITRLEIFSRR